MRITQFSIFLPLLVVAGFGPTRRANPPVETIHPTNALPAALVHEIENPRGYVETRSGEALILDARSQSVFAFNARRGTMRKIVAVGAEAGHILRPSSFDLAANDVLAIADAPGAYGRLQYFGEDGKLIGSFYLANEPGVRLSMGSLSLEGPGTMAFTGRTFVFNAPGSGWLMTEFDNAGASVRGIGALRATGHETDSPLHAALNSGMPLHDPTGGFVFVFQTGPPMFRKYDARGALLFERHIEGVELDPGLSSLPTSWPTRESQQGGAPFVPSLVNAARVDRAGRLWVSLAAGYTYVYDRRGDKIRTIRFEALSPVQPLSLFFTADNRLLVTPGCYEFRLD